jgi:hypothetical protein
MRFRLKRLDIMLSKVLSCLKGFRSRGNNEVYTPIAAAGRLRMPMMVFRNVELTQQRATNLIPQKGHV